MVRIFSTAVALAVSGLAIAQTAAPVDYSDGNNWLCRPGRKDSCAVDLTTTVVKANGKMSNENWTANPQAKIDCFYVYPTVSLDTTPNSDMTAGPEEHSVILSQFARFGSQCRTFAPLYRQVTLTALRAGMSGKPVAADRNLGYNDVLASWNHYLKNDNNGRGFVLIGHSQGSGVLSQLIKNEIDGKAIQKQMISALLLGTSVAVPKGKDVGGTFKDVPLCHSATQLGCAIVYASFRSTVPPPANSLFGRVAGENMQAACTNPAALGGGKGELHSHLSSRARAEGTIPEWVKGGTVETPFVSTPGLITSECVSNDKGSYLEITVNGNPKDPRTDDIGGDVVANGQVQANWGLHLIDVNLAMGNLVDIVNKQAKTYLKK
jgi:Protein of unknown function (DUF3089)